MASRVASIWVSTCLSGPRSVVLVPVVAFGAGRRLGLASRGACGLAGNKGACNMFFCAARAGGGKRCQQEDGCEKSAVGGGSLFCSSHDGGGRRCSVDGCQKQMGIVVCKILR